MTQRRPLRFERLAIRLVAAAAATVLAAALLASGWTWPLDTWIYDFHLNHWHRDPGSSVVIVAIDDRSVSEIGRWPWSRRVHARLLDRLTAIGVRGVAFDVVLSEPDDRDPEGDQLLARAIGRNGRVVMPVLPEQSREGGPIIEVLPLPAITQAAAALGHTDIALDRDGESRGIHLQAGLRSPHWSALGLALLELDPARDLEPPQGLRNREVEQASPYVWVRDRYVRIPFAGPGGTFGRISYVDALRDDATLELLRDRWVLIGVTAQALGRQLQIPVTDAVPQMAGVEFQANAVDTLERGLAITPLTSVWQLLITFALILVPALLHGVRGFRSQRATTLSSSLLALLVSAILLRLFHIWFPPATAVLVFAIGYAVWALGNLRHWRRMASTDSLTEIANRRQFDLLLDRELLAARRVRHPLSLLLVDVDYFKHYNDTYGHRAGDDILRQVGRVVAAHARRPRDLAARFGGDEFALVLPETHAGGAVLVADAVQADIRALDLPHDGSPVVDRVSVSIGMHTLIPDGATQASALYEGADMALYQAKQQGRNRSERLSSSDRRAAAPGRIVEPDPASGPAPPVTD